VLGGALLGRLRDEASLNGVEELDAAQLNGLREPAAPLPPLRQSA
jgi:hypothetical protein